MILDASSQLVQNIKKGLLQNFKENKWKGLALP